MAEEGLEEEIVKEGLEEEMMKEGVEVEKDLVAFPLSISGILVHLRYRHQPEVMGASKRESCILLLWS